MSSEDFARNTLPTHYCVICAARWVNWPDGTWSLLSESCGPCCDNVPMEKAPIVPIQADGSINGQDCEAAKSKYDAANRAEQVTRYRGIVCALCGEPFERHANDWRCPRHIDPRFKFPPTAPTKDLIPESNAGVREAIESDPALGGWIMHEGGDSPIAEPETLVEVFTRGGTSTIMRSGAVLWRYGSYVYEISAPMPRDAEVIFWRPVYPDALLPASIDVVGKAREEAQRRLAMVRGCLDCNADDARFWVAVIDFLKEMERC